MGAPFLLPDIVAGRGSFLRSGIIIRIDRTARIGFLGVGEEEIAEVEPWEPGEGIVGIDTGHFDKGMDITDAEGCDITQGVHLVVGIDTFQQTALVIGQTNLPDGFFGAGFADLVIHTGLGIVGILNGVQMRRRKQESQVRHLQRHDVQVRRRK